MSDEAAKQLLDKVTGAIADALLPYIISERLTEDEAHDITVAILQNVANRAK